MDKRGNFKTAIKELMDGNLTSNGESIDKEVSSNTDQISTNKIISPSKNNDIKNIKSQGSLFSEDIVIEGNLNSKSPISLRGILKGNIMSEDDVFVSGNILGNIRGKNIRIEGGDIEGNIEAIGDVKIDNRSAIVGEIKANRLELKGMLKGNIKVADSVTFYSESLVSGDVAAGNISMELGAKLKGNIVISEGKYDDSVFGKDKNKSKKVMDEKSDN